MPPAWPLYRFIDPSTPELATAVAPAHIGVGAGSLMLARLLADAAAIHSAIVLSVRAHKGRPTGNAIEGSYLCLQGGGLIEPGIWRAGRNY